MSERRCKFARTGIESEGTEGRARRQQFETTGGSDLKGSLIAGPAVVGGSVKTAVAALRQGRRSNCAIGGAGERIERFQDPPVRREAKDRACIGGASFDRRAVKTAVLALDESPPLG